MKAIISKNGAEWKAIDHQEIATIYDDFKDGKPVEGSGRTKLFAILRDMGYTIAVINNNQVKLGKAS
jgi:hypothetical protein